MTTKRPSLQGILNEVYQVAAAECESREAQGGRIGNGHHMAQKIQADLEPKLLERLQYDVLLDAHLLRVLILFLDEKKGQHWYFSKPVQDAIWAAKKALEEHDPSLVPPTRCPVCPAAETQAQVTAITSDICGCLVCGTHFPIRKDRQG